MTQYIAAPYSLSWSFHICQKYLHSSIFTKIQKVIHTINTHILNVLYVCISCITLLNISNNIADQIVDKIIANFFFLYIKADNTNHIIAHNALYTYKNIALSWLMPNVLIDI